MPFQRITDAALNPLTVPPGYLGTANLDGCELSDGWRMLIELFYDPDSGTRRFGTDNFGDGTFGDAGSGSVARWVDITANCTYCSVSRGNIDPGVDQNTDDLTVELLDTEGWLFAWQGIPSLSSPQFNTPLRVSVIDPDTAVAHVVSTGRLDDIQESFTAASKYARTIELHAYGQKTQLITSVLGKSYGLQDADERIDEVLADIGFTDPVEPYPAIFATTRLRQDPDIRTEDDAVAYSIISQAAHSCGYFVGTTAEGSITWVPIAEDGLPEWTVAECEGPGVGAVYTQADYRAGLARVLNVVQLQNKADVGADVEAIDPVSVARWGRRSQGFGFPLIVANDTQSDAQAVADNVLARTANIINRVASVTFTTLNDPRWYALFTATDVNRIGAVQRSYPNPSTYTGPLIGLEFEARPFEGITGTFHLSTQEDTI